jgi:hypothetical protein
MAVDPAATQRRREMPLAQPAHRVKKPGPWLERPRSHASTASWPAPALQPFRAGRGLGSRHGWRASQIVRSALSCGGSIRALRRSVPGPARNTPSRVSLPRVGQCPTQRRFVCGSLSQVYALVHYSTTHRLPIGRTARCDNRHRKRWARSPEAWLQEAKADNAFVPKGTWTYSQADKTDFLHSSLSIS